MKAQHSIPDEQLRMFRTKLLMKLAGTTDPVRLIQVAAVLDDDAARKLEDYIEEGVGRDE